jgi:hypothetical protein
MIIVLSLFDKKRRSLYMKKLMGILILIIIMAILPIAGCASSSTSSAVQEMAPSFEPGVPVPAPTPAVPGAFPTFSGSGAESSKRIISNTDDANEATDVERKIVKTGYMSLVVKDVEQSLDEISNIASSLGGYVVTSNKNQGADIISGNISIRVPAEKYDEAVSKLRAIAVKVPNESTDTQDVTEEYIDLKARLAMLEATEAQYLELMKKAETVEEILKVQQALSDVRQNIESLKGRIQYIERTSDMSLININLTEEATFHEEGWQPLEILKSAVRALISIGQFIGSALIYIIVILAIPAIIGVAIWQIIVAVKRKKKAKL